MRFEAEFLRTALLLGVVRPVEVRPLADALLAADAEPIALLADVALAQSELTTLREALRPLAASPGSTGVVPALLTFLATDPVAVALPTEDRIRILGQLRREDILPSEIAESIKDFEDRWMLFAAGIGHDVAIAADLDEWLASVRRPGYYRVSVGDPDERAALLGALARKVVRDRRTSLAEESGSRAWMVQSSGFADPALAMNETLWHIAIAEFSPLPLASRIPYGALPAGAVLVLDEATAEPMGAGEAAARLSTAGLTG